MRKYIVFTVIAACLALTFGATIEPGGSFDSRGYAPYSRSQIDLPDVSTSVNAELTYYIPKWIPCGGSTVNPIYSLSHAGSTPAVIDANGVATFNAQTAGPVTISCVNDIGPLVSRVFNLAVDTPAGSSAAWTAPYAFPRPASFDQLRTQYTVGNTSAGGILYKDDGTGEAYTHWVDNTGTCDDANTPGSITAPLCTIPQSVPAGSVVIIADGDYQYGSGSHVFDPPCTNTAWCFYEFGDDARLVNDGAFNRRVDFTGNHVSYDGINTGTGDQPDSAVRLRLGDPANTLGPVQVRHLEAYGVAGNCATIGGQQTYVFDIKTKWCHQRTGPNDAHGFVISNGANDVRIAVFETAHNGGNGMQWGNNGASDRNDNIFVTMGTVRSNREAAGTKESGKTVLAHSLISYTTGCDVNTMWCSVDCGTHPGDGTCPNATSPYAWCVQPSQLPMESCTGGDGWITGSDGFPTHDWLIGNKFVGNGRHAVRNEESLGMTGVNNLMVSQGGDCLAMEKGGQIDWVHNTCAYPAQTPPTSVPTTEGCLASYQQADHLNSVFRYNICEGNFTDTDRRLMTFFPSPGEIPTITMQDTMWWNQGVNWAIRLNQTCTVSNTASLDACLNGGAGSEQFAVSTGNTVQDPLLTGIDLVTPENSTGDKSGGSPAIGAAGVTTYLQSLDTEFEAAHNAIQPGLTLIPPDCTTQDQGMCGAYIGPGS